jgi:hypothetical protein
MILIRSDLLSLEKDQNASTLYPNMILLRPGLKWLMGPPILDVFSKAAVGARTLALEVGT